MEELFSVMWVFFFLLRGLCFKEKCSVEKIREVFTSISFVFWISEFHYVAGCFPVSAFSVSGKADVAAAGAITLICSTEKKKIRSFCLYLKRSAMQLWFGLVNRRGKTGKLSLFNKGSEVM